jgi:hypothetical protein
VAVEEHLGRELPLPEELEQDWVNALFTAGQVLTTGVVHVRVTDASVRVKLPNGELPLDVGTELTFRLDDPISETIGPTVVDLGIYRRFADVRVARVEPLDATTVVYHCEPIIDEMVEARIISADDLAAENELLPARRHRGAPARPKRTRDIGDRTQATKVSAATCAATR